MVRVATPSAGKDKAGLAGELDAATAMKAIPWTTISKLRGDADVLAKIDEAEALLRNLRKSVS